MQWLQDTSQINADSLNYVRREVSRHFRNKQRNILKLKFRNLKVRSTLLGTCIGALVTLRRVTCIELI
jgi:hypothetical protein